MKPLKILVTKNKKFSRVKYRTKKIEKADENVQCSIQNIELAYLMLDDILPLMYNFNKTPLHLIKRYNKIQKYIKAEKKYLEKYIKFLGI